MKYMSVCIGLTGLLTFFSGSFAMESAVPTESAKLTVENRTARPFQLLHYTDLASATSSPSKTGVRTSKTPIPAYFTQIVALPNPPQDIVLFSPLTKERLDLSTSDDNKKLVITEDKTGNIDATWIDQVEISIVDENDKKTTFGGRTRKLTKTSTHQMLTPPRPRAKNFSSISEK
jgi:hypothetical protein